MTRSEAEAMRAQIERSVTDASDEEALTEVWMFPAWQTDTSYAANERVRYDDTLYRCVQAHTSQANWTPDATPALWTVVSLDEWPEWVQPTGASDAYMTGDKVSHADKHWVSMMDYNVWEPGTYDQGWREA